eukprot:CAMPEP_0181493652 /NCGR_PEP_ID=MMETSP1110-20121109/51339_1 /TAXON_ID=174948 /ORGANISM="Symbiodinium sp., Strain CCMP421" /LENGTH=75 /DNA_ID=CAMNT_0023620985 /DNA_START=1 /DNA_END=224 /DNA_ORIENTATION=-
MEGGARSELSPDSFEVAADQVIWSRRNDEALHQDAIASADRDSKHEAELAASKLQESQGGGPVTAADRTLEPWEL